ncbi:c-type cytochrome [Nitrospira sp. NS4]|uniref:c-type cytochrome n=1 Tax=Nitrospira sp. NS4 TaxID=3414498 RepID=UPI003C2E77FA
MRFAGIMLSLFVGMTSVGFGGGAGVKDLSMPVKQYDAVAGREIYTNTCIRCHGIDGKGAMSIQLVPQPADLSSQAVQSRLDASLFKRIHDGKPNTAMGAWSTTLSDDEIWDVLAYVRTLRQE